MRRRTPACKVGRNRYNRGMNKIIALSLLCPLTALGAEWSYDGEAAAGGERASSGTEMSTAAASASPASLPAQAPANNMTMSMVREATGEPQATMDAVGEPPITRWQYPDYVVYFERDRVIISVAGRW